MAGSKPELEGGTRFDLRRKAKKAIRNAHHKTEYRGTFKFISDLTLSSIEGVIGNLVSGVQPKRFFADSKTNLTLKLSRKLQSNE